MYCNYNKDKFGNELTFILPSWWDNNFWDLLDSKSLKDSNGKSWIDYNSFYSCFNGAEEYYMALIKKGWTPQQVRAILPNALKTEINMCGFLSDWKHFFELRDSEKAHPDMVTLVKPLHEEFNRTYFNNNNN